MSPLLQQWTKLCELEEVANAFPLWRPLAKEAEAKLVAVLQRQGGSAIVDNILLRAEAMKEDGKIVGTWITAKLIAGEWPTMIRTVHPEQLVGPHAWKRGLDLNQIPAEPRRAIGRATVSRS